MRGLSFHRKFLKWLKGNKTESRLKTSFDEERLKKAEEKRQRKREKRL